MFDLNYLRAYEIFQCTDLVSAQLAGKLFDYLFLIFTDLDCVFEHLGLISQAVVSQNAAVKLPSALYIVHGNSFR